MNEGNNCFAVGESGWDELAATDELSQKEFYASLFGWTTGRFYDGGHPCTVFKKGDTIIDGLMKCPQPGVPSHWLAYVNVEDVDTTAAIAKRFGARITVEPTDIPDLGRIAVFHNPRGAAIGIFKSAM